MYPNSINSSFDNISKLGAKIYISGGANNYGYGVSWIAVGY